MKRIFLTSAFSVLVCASLAAQATQSTPPTAAAPPAAPAAANAVVVQGCIQPSVNAVSATPDAVGTSGRSVSTATAFILTDAMKPTGTSGSSASSSAAVAPTYQLSVEDSKLIPHVGHLVEISGNLVSPDPSSSTAAASAKGAPAAPTLKVENVKMIKETCTN
jgi:hypothetical protein